MGGWLGWKGVRRRGVGSGRGRLGHGDTLGWGNRGAVMWAWTGLGTSVTQRQGQSSDAVKGKTTWLWSVGQRRKRQSKPESPSALLESVFDSLEFEEMKTSRSISTS